MPYFSQFPTITYANTVVTDVTRRVVVPSSVLRQPTVFSPYTVEGSQRMDTVSYQYYDQQDDDDWLILLANQIVDPYYGWYLDIDQLTAFVEIKYGSMAAAFQRVHHWQCNWASDNRNISIGYYQALTPNLQKYWMPYYGSGSEVLSYTRREADWTVATNQFVNLTFQNNAPWSVTDLLSVYDTNGALQGTAEVSFVSGSNVTIKDVSGTWANGYSVSDGVNALPAVAVSAPNHFIPIDEIVYFTSISCYDYEYDLNERNKEVLLIQDSWRGTMYTELDAALVSKF